MEDITERKRTEAVIEASEKRYRSLFENMVEGFAYCKMLFEDGRPQDFVYLAVNPAFGKLTGLQDVADKKVSEAIPGIRESDPELFEIYGRVALGGEPERFETYVAALDIWFDVFVYCPEREYFIAVFDNINERKRSEEKLVRLNHILKTLSDGNRTLIFAEDEMQLLRDMCWVIVETGGYYAAWVGYAQQDEEKTIRPVAQQGLDKDYLETLAFTWADNEQGQCPAGRAIRSGQPQVFQDIGTDRNLVQWREQAMKLGAAACIVLPLKEGKLVFGSLNVYADEANAFSEDEIRLLQEMSEDLAFGIETMRLRREQERITKQLRKGLEGTVQAVSAMVEIRDPYTAGHERRVAELATAIAQEMGLAEEQVRGIHLAGTIHDLGKIQVPAEILSKPGRLTDNEFNLIKQHPQTGYEILKGIDFPWPIAQMVLQHHERLDGSGYPQGLKGEAIMVEARILAVSDVVEAMASHRPYRPGLGVSSALDEIRKNSGKFYDADVVDACIRLFNEKNYTLPEAWAKR